MSLNLSCWDNIIGISRTECECYDEIASLSNSGLYLDELVELRSISGLINCEKGNDVFAIMEKARDTATRIFQGDANMMLMNSFMLRVEPFYGKIGRVKYTDNMAVTSGKYYGMRIFCVDFVSGVFIIKKIGTLFSQTGTITAYLYNNLNQLLHTFTLNTTANQHNENTLATQIELPLHNGHIDNLEYFLIYQAGSNAPKNNDIKCGCGKFNAVFDTTKPYWFATHSSAQYYWTHYAMVGSFVQSSIADLSNLSSTSGNYLYGLTLDVEFKCKINEVLCKDYFDFDANPMAIATALAIWYKAGELLINDILRTPNVNRNVVINRDVLQEDVRHLRAMYDEKMKYIIKNVSIKTNDCLKCRDIREVVKTGLFA